MSEKDMVLDVLTGVKGSIGTYAKSITECCDLNLRQTLQQMSGGDQQFQYDLYKIAEQKGYYIPGPKATQQDLQDIKTKLNQSITEVKGASPIPVLQ